MTTSSRLVLALGLVLAAVPADAAPPEIVRIRVPAAQVPGFFAPGTQMRILSPEAFSSLMDDANRQAAVMAAPKLVRAHHRARWAKDVLSGRSELIAELPSSVPTAPAARSLDTRDPPAEARAPGRRLARIREERDLGRARRAARPDGHGEPGLGASGPPRLGRPRLRVGPAGRRDVGPGPRAARGLGAVGPGEQRRGPLPAAQAGFRTWWFHGRPGLSNLQLRRPGEPQTPRDGNSLWVSGPTRIVLGEDQAARAANWETEWSVQSEHRGPAGFTAILDPGLDLIDVAGPDVIEFQADPEGAATRVKVSLSGNARSPTTVHFRAHARVAIEGPWKAPAIRPVDAIWTGGTTTLVLDPLHVIQDCRELAGRRVPTRGAGASRADTLVFEASSPDPVAELVLRQPRVEESCLVRGRLVAGAAVPELECELVGLGGRSSACELDIDLPPSWIPGQVQWNGVTQSLAWSSTMQSDGGTRLHVVLPGREGTADDRVLLVLRHLHRGPGPRTAHSPTGPPPSHDDQG